MNVNLSKSLMIAAMMALSWASPSFAQSNDANGDQLIVEADESLEWFRVEKKYIATGKASATRGDTRLDADVIIADYVDITAEGDGDATTNITHIEGQKNAVFTRGSLKASGTNITYDIKDEKAVMTGQNAKIINRDETLTANQSITYDRKARTITAIGNAHVVLSNGQELKGNMIEATLNDGENDITHIYAAENAEVFSPGKDGIRQAFAKSMTYEKETGIAVLTDNVILKEGGNVMKGDKAVIDTIKGTSTMSSTGSGKRVGGVFLPQQN